jgi:hypothetical protein
MPNQTDPKKQGRGSNQEDQADEKKASSQNEGSDLKQREYKDEQGKVHHHTHEYMEREKKE